MRNALYLRSQYRGGRSVDRCSSPPDEASAKVSFANHFEGNKSGTTPRGEREEGVEWEGGDTIPRGITYSCERDGG